MLNVLWWVVTIEAMGLVAFPIAYSLLPSLKDRGYSISKPLGLLFIGYLSWILSVLHIVPSIRISIVSILLLVGVLSAWHARRRWRDIRRFVLEERRVILAAEAIFILVFLGWALFRAYDPSIDHTEQPMDFNFLNASIQSRVGSPEDPWLRGEPVSYYYFGYWMMGTATQLTGMPSNVSYNLALALIPAMAASAIFGLVYTVVSADGARRRWAFAGGIASAVLLGLVANLEGVLEFMRANGMGWQRLWDWLRIDGLDGPAQTLTQSWHPTEFWWWFRSTRVINTFDGTEGLDYTIQEFPFFSFMLGDLHPHVMSIPFVILFMALSWNFLRSPVRNWMRPSVRSYSLIAVMGLALGGLAFTNLWDFPTFAALFLGIAVMKAYPAHGARVWSTVKAAVPVSAAVIALAFLLYLPYYFTFRAGVGGIDPVPLVTTRPVHLFIVWGVYLVSVTPFIVGSFLQTRVGADWRRLSVVGLLVGFVPYLIWAFLHLQDGGTAGDLPARLFHVLPFALLIALAVYGALWHAKHQGQGAKPFVLALSAMGLLLIMGPELLFVNDRFGNRMNTVFKLYYEAWVLLAASSGFAIHYWGSIRTALGGRVQALAVLWAGVFIVLVAGSLYYAPAAAVSKAGSFGKGATLDGLAFVNPAEREAIEYLRANAAPGAGMVEAVGEWFDAGLISRSTGIPTVINWPGHEIQWRGSAAKLDGRAEDVARIYQSLSAEEAAILLRKYDVDFVYVGPRERAKYGTEGLEKLDSFLDKKVFSEDVAVYTVR
ncbi:MAG: hypothetical protein IH862_08870 [Chloroflexi bacterium]|nr:hypothetical protein [Chloroflexota bacterium]